MARRRGAQTSALLLIAIMIGAAASFRSAPCAEPHADSSEINAWIEQLDSEDFDVRTAAAAKLNEVGEAARPALEKALVSADAQARADIVHLLELRTHSSLRVMAFDRNAQPVNTVEATLQVYDASDPFQNSRTPYSVTFNKDGVAEVIGVKPSAVTLNFNVQKGFISGGQYNSSYFGGAYTIRGGVTPILFSISHGGSVKGLIKDKEGKPVKDADFCMYHAGNFNADMLEVREDIQPIKPISKGSTDAKGEALLENLDDGVYWSVASINGSAVVGTLVRVREGQTSIAPPIEIAVAARGKYILSPRGIIDDQNKEDIKNWQQQWNRGGNNANNTDKPKEEPKKDPKAPLVAEALKNIKMTVEEEYLYEGPDGAKKQRDVAAELSRYNRYRQKPQFDADDNGKITLENLRAGRHRVRIECVGFAPKTMIVEIPPGGTVDAGALTLDPGGAVAVKAVSTDNKPVPDAVIFAIPEDENAAALDVPAEVLNFVRGSYSWDEAKNFMRWQRQRNRRPNPSGDKEKATLKNLPPGKYSMLVFRELGATPQQVFIVGGVNIEEGKTTELAPIRFAGVAKTIRSASGDGAMIKGKVIGLTNENVTRCTLFYQSSMGSSGTNLSPDGTFQISTNGVGEGGVIHIKVPGFKKADFDCTTAGIDLSKIEIKLEKLTYGSIRVLVVDENGKPLEGAAIDPAPVQNTDYFYSYNRRQRPVRKTSNIRGEAFFSGLSIGRRRIQVAKEGYFLTDPIRVTIRADEEAQVVVMMRTGLKISGALKAPEGIHFENAVVSLRTVDTGSILSITPNATGQFSFEGLSPGHYSLFAEAPALVTELSTDINLNGESLLSQDLKMIERGGFALRVDPLFKGRMASLMTGEDFDNKKSGIKRRRSNGYGFGGYSIVDSAGCIEFWGVKAGTYRLSVAGAANRDYMQAFSDRPSAVECTVVSDEFEIKAPRKFSELKLEDAARISFPQATASAKAIFVLKKSPSDASAQSSGIQPNVMITIKGAQCTGSYNPGQRNRRNQGSSSTAKLKTIGTLPKFLLPSSAAPGGTTAIKNLVPGKYTIQVMSYVYNPVLRIQEETETVIAAEFEVKAGESKDLGTILIEPSKTIVRETTGRRATQESGDKAAEEDMDPIFEP